MGRNIFGLILIVGIGFGLLSNPVQAENWQQFDGPYGGRIEGLAISSGGDIFAATWGGGVYKSDDKGETWSVSSSGLTDPLLKSIAISDNGDLYVEYISLIHMQNI